MIDLSGCVIFDIYGIKRIELQGLYSAESLSQTFIDEWVSFVRCGKKCSRSFYCKFTKTNPYWPDKLDEVKCGVVVEMLKNFTKVSFNILNDLSIINRQNYLDGAYYLSQFVLNAEFTIGDLSNSETIDWYGEYAPGVFGHVVKPE